MSRRWRNLTYEEQGVSLNRIEALQTLVPDQVVLQAIAKCHNGRSRSCPLTQRVLVWVILAMGLFKEMPTVSRSRQDSLPQCAVSWTSAGGQSGHTGDPRLCGQNSGRSRAARLLFQGITANGHRWL